VRVSCWHDSQSKQVSLPRPHPDSLRCKGSMRISWSFIDLIATLALRI
jgi:hypothetical protein